MWINLILSRHSLICIARRWGSSRKSVKDANRWTKVHRGMTYVYIFPQKRVAPQDNPHKNIGTFGYFFFK